MTFPNPLGLGRSPRGESVLTRLSTQTLSSSSAPLTATQSQVDGLVSHFVQEAANPQTLGAIVAGSLAYRYARLGVMAWGANSTNGLAALAPHLSIGVGLGAEVTAFEGTARAISSLRGDRSNPNLWSLGGQGGWQQGWLSSLITFGMLKSGGALSRETNVVFQHAFSSTAMVLGHNTAGALGITPRPEGTLAEQFLHAEATNIQLGAGTALLHRMAPGLHAMERGLDVSLHSREVTPFFRNRGIFPSRELSLAGASEGAPGNPDGVILSGEGTLDPIQGPQILMMAGRGRKGRRPAQSPGTLPVSRRPPVSRLEMRSQIERVTTRLGELRDRYEGAILGLLKLSQEQPTNKNLEPLINRLQRKHSRITRELVMGQSSLEPKGGAETWEMSRLQKLVDSQETALRECRKFFKKMKLPPNLPVVTPRPGQRFEVPFERMTRLFRSVGLDPNLVRRLMAMIPPSRTEDRFLLLGMEGLMTLIDGAPRDEREAIITLIKRITYADPSDFDSFRELMVLTMNFQYGSFSRPNVMNVLHSTNTFHNAYPLARGPFIELFKMRLATPREAFLVEAPLNFARDHLGNGDRVTLETRTSTGFASFLVESSGREKSRYIVGGFANPLRSQHGFLKIASHFMEAFPESTEEGLSNRIYMEIPSLDAHLSPERLRSWAIELISGERTIETLAQESLKDSLIQDLAELKLPKGSKEQQQAQLEASLNEKRAYWRRLIPRLDQVEISYPVVRRLERASEASSQRETEYRREIIDRKSESREQLIASLREKVSRTHDQADVVKLFTILMESRRRDEAIELLRIEKEGPQDRKKIRHLYRETVRESLRTLFEKDSHISVFSPQFLRFLSQFFGRDYTVEQMEGIFALGHPDYRIAEVMVNLHGPRDIRFEIPVVTRYNEEAGDFSLHLSLGEKGPSWMAELGTAGMNREEGTNHQGQGVGLFMMERIFRFLRELGVSRFEIDASNIGRYAWLRMGGEFVYPEMRDEISNKLADFAGRHGYGLTRAQITRMKTSEGMAELMASLEPEHLTEFLANYWLREPRYFFSLDENSQQMRRFQTYFINRASAILKRKAPPGEN